MMARPSGPRPALAARAVAPIACVVSSAAGAGLMLLAPSVLAWTMLILASTAIGLVAGSIVTHLGATARAVMRLAERDRPDRLNRSRVRAVVAGGESLQIAYQPVIDLRTRHTVGHEALARFGHGPPELWFSEAHNVGLGVELEMTAILKAWDGRPQDGYLAVNVSPITLMSDMLIDFARSNPTPERLVVELTEHAVVENYEHLRAALALLRSLGVRVAVDDAGSGISSFRHILTIAPDIVKLDRSLIAKLESDPARRALGEALVQFAAQINADLVAEGIERVEERTACLDIGIRYGQGYLLGRPLLHMPHRT